MTAGYVLFQEYYQSQYANQLMFSEWMEETPPDLHSDWLLKICPPGKRCLVVTRRVRRRCLTHTQPRSHFSYGLCMCCFMCCIGENCRPAMC